MASADLSDELDCSICLSIYTDPVTMRCGHNFCRGCIDQALDTQDESGDYSCPDCREKFKKRPTLKSNTTLCNVAERFLSTEPHQEKITGICCTYCVDSPVPAVKSCLLCEVSVCNKHLRVHKETATDHILTDPSTSLKNKKCSIHRKILEYYCTEDAACICVSCSLAGEHRGHQVEMLNVASEKKKKKLRNVLLKLITISWKGEERVRNLEARKRKVQENASEEAKRVTALFIEIRKRMDDLEKKVLSEISRQEEQVSLSLSDEIQKLELQKDELSRKMRHIEELCNMTDPLTVLQEPDTGDLCDPEEDGGDEDTGGHDGHDEDIWEHDGGYEDTWEQDVSDEDNWERDGGDEDTWEHDRDNEDIWGHDEDYEYTGEHDEEDEDIWGYDEDDNDPWRHDGDDEEIWGHDVDYDKEIREHDGGDEDTGGHDREDEDIWGHDEDYDDTWRHEEDDEERWGHDEDYDDTWRHDGDDEEIWGHDEDDDDTWRQEEYDEERWGHDEEYDDTWRHDGDDEEIWGHDEDYDDTWRHEEYDEEIWENDGDDEDTGHNGGDEDTGGHDKTHDVDVEVIAGMLHAGFSDIITYLLLISPAKPEEMRPQPLSV